MNCITVQGAFLFSALSTFPENSINMTCAFMSFLYSCPYFFIWGGAFFWTLREGLSPLLEDK